MGVSFTGKSFLRRKCYVGGLTVIRNGTVLTRIYGTANTIPQTAVVCAGVFVSTHSLPQTLGIATLTWS